MNKIEFMKELARLLSDIPSAEREEALEYYEHYFDDAGAENEQQVISSLESPEKVAEIIREGLSDKTDTSGEYTERGYYTHEKGKEEIRISNENSGKKVSSGTMILLIILAVFTLPIWGGVGIGILSSIFGILVAAIAIVCSVAIAGFALLLASVLILVASFTIVLSSPATGILLMGASLCVAAIGFGLSALGIWIIIKVIPPALRGIVKLCRKPFEGRKERNL